MSSDLENQPSHLAVLGSTGSIGTQTLDIVDKYPGRFEVIALTAGKNKTLFEQQLQRHHPKLATMAQPCPELAQQFPDIEFVEPGPEGMEICASHADVETVVMGILGFAALRPTLSAVRANKRIALANKEALIAGGALLKQALAKSQAELIPVDSEHSALFQLSQGQARDQIASMVLTASGGPFWNQPELPWKDVTPEMAVRHPNWSMGAKISVDSATLMNKGLEVIEAHYLFDYAPENIEVWIHPQSLVHGALRMVDESCLLQMNAPDMRGAIGYALTYPERLDGVMPKLTLERMAELQFYPPNTDRFPCLRLAYEALKAGPAAIIALNAGNEKLVGEFLEGKLGFDAIPKRLESLLSRTQLTPVDTLEAIYHMDELARATV